MKRIALFLLTNLAVLVMLGVVVRALGVDSYLSSMGLNMPVLLAFSAVVGFGGSLISLLLSKTMARWSTRAQTIGIPATPTESWLLATVEQLARRSNIGMPEVAIYEGAPNAFATGASRNRALVAVSTGLLQEMPREEIEAVLAHEVGHVVNGDMVTLTLIQGVLNTFVVFLSRIVGFAVDRFVSSSNDRRRAGPAYYAASLFCEIIFGVLATMIVMAFSRRREFRADRHSALALGTAAPMIGALMRLANLEAGTLPPSLNAMGITASPGWIRLFASHPTLNERIVALQEPSMPS